MSDDTTTTTTQDTPEYLTVKPGDILTFDILTWQNEGYEFGRPCLMLSPVIREDSDHEPWNLVESVAMDFVCFGKALKNNQQDQINWRGWNLKTKRRRFNEALKGKEFPIAGYRATRTVIEIVKDEKWENGLNYREISTVEGPE